MIEYASNATISAFTEISAFMTNYDFESRMSFDSINSSESARERIMQFKEVNIAEKMQKMIDFIKRKLAIAQESQKRHADSKRTKASDYKKNDLV
jgi:outer membrane cobalamin receptor